jgi:hypothetical protein
VRVLVACEYSGRVREAFRSLGHDAWSCDLLPSDDGSEYHLTSNVLSLLEDGWDMMIAFPPCTYLCSSGLHWNKRVEGRSEKTEEALEFVRSLMFSPINKIAIENPVGRIGTAIRKADQSIHPYMFGDDASKRTCLWLKNLEKLKATGFVEPRIVNGKPRWANQTDSGQNRLAPSADRWKERSKTYQGIANAMAHHWG